MKSYKTFLNETYELSMDRFEHASNEGRDRSADIHFNHATEKLTNEIVSHLTSGEHAEAKKKMSTLNNHLGYDVKAAPHVAALHTLIQHLSKNM